MNLNVYIALCEPSIYGESLQLISEKLLEQVIHLLDLIQKYIYFVQKYIILSTKVYYLVQKYIGILFQF